MYEAEELPGGDWGVVNYATGQVAYEALTEREARELADYLNDRAEDARATEETEKEAA